MERLLELVLSLAIVGSALAFGGVQPLTYSLVEAAIFLAVLFLLLKQTRNGKVVFPLPLWPVLFALLAVFQVIPLPSGLVARLSPVRLAGLDLAGPSDSRDSWMTLSVYPHESLLGLVKFLALVCAFVLTACLFDSRKRKSTLLKTLVIIGCVEAAYGIVQYLTGWQKIFTYTKQYDLSEATGTYINRNHFAGLLELTCPFIVTSVLYHFQVWSGSRRPGAIRRPRGTDGVSPSQIYFYLFLLVIVSLGIVFSRSRGGILASVFSIVFMALLALPKVQRKGWMIGVFLFLVCAAALAIWIGLSPVLARFEQIGDRSYLSMEPRISFWKDSLRYVRDYPVTGTGLGTFGLGFRHYQTTTLEKYVDHAHNDYLEVAAETGVAGAALFFLPILWLLAKMITSFLDDTGRYRGAVTLGCIGSTVALLLHSLTDFNLQIQANALVFAVVLGIAYKIVFIERREPLPAAPA